MPIMIIQFYCHVNSTFKYAKTRHLTQAVFFDHDIMDGSCILRRLRSAKTALILVTLHSMPVISQLELA
ncbi:hypothetical protein SAMN05216344_107159 [Polaromonas sp. OV174]|nr:hypothetical protein SAMN05216344_107159 [Polaromonas sp. OV174]